MKNMIACFTSQPTTAKLIDLRRKIRRLVDVPVTAAELMLEEPGHVISPLDGLRLSAMKADECLVGGRVYLLVHVTRVKCGKLSESEMTVIKSVCGEKKTKRRSSKVIPDVQEVSNDCSDDHKQVSDVGSLNQYRMRQWKPALEPIREEI